ncbi:MAG: hypothetical protein AB7E36_14835 [Salinivirgaceae bacterium]
MQTDFEILGRKLVDAYPAIAEKLITNPILTDFSHIPDIVKIIYQQPQVSNTTNTKKVEYLVAVIIKLYDPDLFTGYKRKMKTGLRRELNKYIPGTPTYISNIYKKVDSLFNIYKSFNVEVNNIVSEISSKFTEASN